MTDETERENEVKETLPVPVDKSRQSLVPLDPLTRYLNEISQYEPLTEEEERRLGVRLKEEGDVQAAYRLTTAHLMLVVRIAMTFRREWQNLMDLIQEGNVGLMKAVKNFDPLRGVRLSAYASWWIKSYILKYLLDNWRLVKVGTTNVRRKLLYNLKKEKEKLEREGFVPSTKLLAERFGVDEGEVIDVQAGLGAADVSIDTPLHPDSPATPAHTLANDESVEGAVESALFREMLNKHLDRLKDDLKPIEIEILENRILSEDPRSLQEIGNDYTITREAVRQAEQRLMKKIKNLIYEKMPELAENYQNPE